LPEKWESNEPVQGRQGETGVIPSIESIQIQSAEISHAASEVRRLVLEHVVSHNGGYLSQAWSSAEILTTLYMHLMKLAPSIAPMVPEPFDDSRITNPQYLTVVVTMVPPVRIWTGLWLRHRTTHWFFMLFWLLPDVCREGTTAIQSGWIAWR
jgi:hypothetical protein